MKKQDIMKVLIEANDLVDRALNLVEDLCNDLDDADIYNEDMYAAVDDIRTTLEHVQGDLVTMWNEDD